MTDLPDGLEELGFHSACNVRLEEVDVPRSLRTLTYGAAFNQPLEFMNWPDLQVLNFGLLFDQELKEVIFPATLKLGRH
eukprot:g7104.t1